MQSLLLQAYCLKLYDTMAKSFAAKKTYCHLAVIENCINNEKLQIVNFKRAGKRHSLPFVIFNKEFQIITKQNMGNNNVPGCSRLENTFDVVLSLFNLHSFSKEGQINFIQKMQHLAPKAIFLDYENPERNLAYAGYWAFSGSQYITCLLEKIFSAQKNSVSCFQEYCKNGALEGILHEMPMFSPERPVKILERKHYGFGGIGMAYLEWQML